MTSCTIIGSDFSLGMESFKEEVIENWNLTDPDVAQVEFAQTKFQQYHN